MLDSELCRITSGCTCSSCSNGVLTVSTVDMSVSTGVEWNLLRSELFFDWFHWRTRTVRFAAKIVHLFGASLTIELVLVPKSKACSVVACHVIAAFLVHYTDQVGVSHLHGPLSWLLQDRFSARSDGGYSRWRTGFEGIGMCMEARGVVW